MAVFVGSVPVQTERGRKREKGREEANTQSRLEGKLGKREAGKYTGMKREGKSAA